MVTKNGTYRRFGVSSAAAVSLALAASIAMASPASASTNHPPAPPKYGTSHGTSPAQAAHKSSSPILEYGKTPRGPMPQYANGTYVGTTGGATGRCGYALCLYWDSNQGGAAAGFGNYVADLTGYTFPSNGAGGGSAIINDAASIENQSIGIDDSYYDQNYLGGNDWLNSQSYGNLVQTWNNEASIDMGII